MNRLRLAWQIRRTLRLEATLLRRDGERIGSAEAEARRAEHAMLWAKGNKIWADTVIGVRGNVSLEWVDNGRGMDCLLGTGEVFLAKEAHIDDRPSSEMIAELSGMFRS